MRVYVSTVNLGSGPLPQVMEEMGHLPYPAVEISSGHQVESDSWNSILGYVRAHDAAVLLHNYAPPEPDDLLINLSNPDPAVRSQVIRFVKSRIDMTEELGADYYSFHAGYRVPYRFGVRHYPPSEVLPRERALEIFVEALKVVMVYAEERSVHVGVENHIVEHGNEGNLILDDEADFESLFHEIDSDFLHLHLDVGHLKVTAQTLGVDPHSFIEAFRHKIVGVHLNDNDGTADHHQPFDRDAWFLESLRRLPELRYACLETRSHGDKDQIKAMVTLLEGL